MKDSDDQRYDQSSLGEKVRKGYKLVDISKIVGGQNLVNLRSIWTIYKGFLKVIETSLAIACDYEHRSMYGPEPLIVIVFPVSFFRFNDGACVSPCF